MSELLPCPFCGGESTAINIKNINPKDEKTHRIVCLRCMAKSSRGYDERHVTNLWNKRVKQ
jgi:Lar family restriction alleviation protein